MAILISCTQVEDKRKSQYGFKVCKLITISPYGCYQELEVTDERAGVIRSGLKRGNVSDKDVSMDTLFYIDSFLLRREDMGNVNKIIISILDSGQIISGPKHDAYRHRLFVDNVEIVDIYGLSVQLRDLLKEMIGYLPVSKDNCEFFELFRKTISSDTISK